MRAAIAFAFIVGVGGGVGGGCGPVGPQYAKVDPATITAVQISTGNVTTYCPGGDAVVVGATVTLSDGRVLQMATSGETGDGRIPPTAFEWTTSWGRVDGGRLELPYDPFAALDRDVTIDVGVVDRPDLRSSITLAPSFRCGGAYVTTGAYGDGGYSGERGQSGRDGGSGSATTRAGDGEDGQDGGRGGSGGNGGPGHLLRAWVGYVDTARHGRLAVVLVVDGGSTARFLFDPAGARFQLGSFGGPGGSGGSGGDGGNGGDGGAYTDSATEGDGGNGADGGNGGDGGDGGDGGAAGDLEVVYDRRFPELAQLIDVATGGGAAGSAGYGGSGGAGGNGGSTSKGRAGQGGHGGAPGREGRMGRSGPDGRAPTVEPGDVRQAFAFLGEVGLSLATK